MAAATSKRQRVLFTQEPQTPTKRLPTINLIEATPSTLSSSTSSALAPRIDGGRPSVRVVPRKAKTPSRLPVPVSKRPTGAVRRARVLPETPPPPPPRPSVAQKSTQAEPQPAPPKVPPKPHKGSLKPLHLLQRAARAKVKDTNDTPQPPDSPGFVNVGFADTPPSGSSAIPSPNSSLSRLAPPSDDPDISEVVIVPKQKKRPGLDFDWALGGVPAPESKPVERQDNERPASVKILDKTSWWSTLGRGRRKEKDNDTAERGMSLHPSWCLSGLTGYYRFFALDFAFPSSIHGIHGTRVGYTGTSQPHKHLEGRPATCAAQTAGC